MILIAKLPQLLIDKFHYDHKLQRYSSQTWPHLHMKSPAISRCNCMLS